MKFLQAFSGQNAKKINGSQEIKDSYRYWRLRIFYSMYIGYAFFYATRKSFTFAMPAMMVDLGFSKTDLGILGSILYITYGISKFASGILSDRSNSRYFISIGLILTGIFNILFGLSSTVGWFAIFWGCNGWFQGWGWPPCARLLTHWYSQSERGRWWGIWNTSHNVGGALIPIFIAFLAEHFNWRISMYVSGISAMCISLFLMNRLRDTPRSLGLPSIEEFRNEPDNQDEHQKGKNKERFFTSKEIVFDLVFKNSYVWLLGIAYFFVYVVRTVVNDWGQLYLYENKSLSLMTAGSCIFGFEIGGFLGSLFSGWLSDKWCGGRRGPINVLFSFLSFFGIVFLWVLPSQALFLSFLSMFVIGFFIFGPQMLIGIAATEFSHKQAAGTATGFVGCFAYVGAAVSGFPFGKVIQDFGWTTFFVVLGSCAIIAGLCLIPLWSLKSREKKIFKKESDINRHAGNEGKMQKGVESYD